MERSRNGRRPQSLENRVLVGIGALGVAGLIVLGLMAITDPGSSSRSSIAVGPTTTTRSGRLPDTGPPLQLGPVPTTSTSTATTTTTLSPSQLAGLARLKLVTDLQALARTTTTTTTRPAASTPPPTSPPPTAPPPTAPPTSTTTSTTTTTPTKPDRSSTSG